VNKNPEKEKGTEVRCYGPPKAKRKGIIQQDHKKQQQNKGYNFATVNNSGTRGKSGGNERALNGTNGNGNKNSKYLTY